MKKLLTAIAFIGMTCAGLGHAAEKTVRIGTEGAYAPFNYTDASGQLKGFEIDLAMALCEEMKVKCVLVQQDWDGMIPALLAKKYDAIMASMAITEERKQKVDFSDKYYNVPSKFVHKKGSGIQDVSPEALKGKTVGVQRGTIQDNYLTELYEKKGVRITRYGTQEEANLDLTAGRVDLLFADSVALSDGFLKTDAGKGYEFVGPDFTDPKWFGSGVGVAVRKGDNELREAFNKAITAVRASGKYDEIAKKYFDFDIYGK
ncbi:MAG TPA: ABC transporter substrate-binding protein [Candidatus Competibacteraceae bacterium]|nr:ABC transporter substrate-binding protein [Candidatus Competibacteraceae bacterium]